MVRVGGRSKSEKLNSFLLSNIKRTVQLSRRTEADLYHRIRDQRNILAGLQRELNFYDNLLNNLFMGCIVPFKKVQEYIKHEHLDQLYNRFSELKVFKDRTNDDYSLLEWLGLINIEVLEYEFVQNFENLDLNEVKQGINSDDLEKHANEVKEFMYSNIINFKM